MKRVLIALATACAAALALGAPAASADVTQSVYKCEADATWQVTLNLTGQSYADVTYDTGAATNTGCKRVNATVQSDGDFSASLSDFGYSATHRWNLTGVAATGIPGTFAGVASYADGSTGKGTFVFANGTTLNATLAYVASNGDQSTAEVYGTSSCGTNCYRTHMVIEGTTPPLAP